MTAREFMKDADASREFYAACRRVGIESTIRQARKWRRKAGKAWKEGQK